jgi:hypothetical protein
MKRKRKMHKRLGKVECAKCRGYGLKFCPTRNQMVRCNCRQPVIEERPRYADN